MDSVTFTESANRSLKRMQLFAFQFEAERIEPLHLLLALLAEESRASELLKESGISPEKIEQEFSLTLSELLSKPFEEEQSDANHSRSEVVKQIISEAVQFANEAGRYGEVGSEHLLWGLSNVESEIQKFLTRNSLKTDQLRSSVFEVTGISLEPLSTDEQLKFREVTQSDQTAFLRILDASANRAREGFRVLEDYVRFVLDDPLLSASLKEARHSLGNIFRRFPSLQVTSARETLADVGTRITTDSEKNRPTAEDLVRANFKRVEEALRSLEEYSKTIEPASSSEFESVRYQIYTIEKAIENRFRLPDRLQQACLYLLVTEDLCHHGSGPAIRESLTGGVDVVQLREKEMDARELIERGLRIRKWTDETGALFIMNDRVDLVSATGADGVHLGQEDLPVYQARKILGGDSLIGVSTHNMEQARQAVLDGADYIGVGPVFTSGTKDFDQLAGLEFVRQVSEEIRIPWFAIGGIDIENVQQVVDAGASRIAVSGVICRSESPAGQAERLKSRLSPKTSHE